MFLPMPGSPADLLTVHDLAARGLELRVTCPGCRHRARIPGDAMAALLAARRRASGLDEAARILRCSMCGRRTPEVRALPVADARQRAFERREARD